MSCCHKCHCQCCSCNHWHYCSQCGQYVRKHEGHYCVKYTIYPKQPTIIYPQITWNRPANVFDTLGMRPSNIRGR